MVNYHYMFVNTKIFGVISEFFTAGIFVATTKLLGFLNFTSVYYKVGKAQPS